MIALMEAAYEAALDPSAWSGLLERIATQLRALAVLCVRDEARRSLALTWAMADGAVPEPVLLDRRTQAWMGRPARPGVTAASGRTLLDAASDEAREWRLPLVRTPGCMHATTSLLRDELVQSTLTVVRADVAPLEAGERELLDALAPHLRRAVRIAHRLQALDPVEGDARLALDRLRMGVLVLDADLNVLLANHTAETMLGAGSGIRKVRGKLLIPERDAHARLLAHARACAGGHEPDAAAPGGALRVGGPPGRSLSLLVAPLRARAADGTAACARSVVFISDPDAAVHTPDDLFESLFGLTAAQARVAVLLMQGNTPDECARSLGSSLNTVRTHLKRIFEKTGTTRQSELVRLLLSSPAAHHRHFNAGPATRTRA